MNLEPKNSNPKNAEPTSTTESTPDQLVGEVVPVAAVTVAQRDQMFELMCQYYDNMCRRSFEDDLDEKDWVIVASLPSSLKVKGFSTQKLIEITKPVAGCDGEQESKVLFSGDTIIDRQYWSRNPLAQLWGRLSLWLMDEYPEHRLFWFLISKGFRTYRFLPVFFREFFPRCDTETPEWASGLIKQLAMERYPETFDMDSGIVRAGDSGCRLRQGVADVVDVQNVNKHIRFFQQRNPWHARGDELCCLAPLSRENFKRGAYRVIGDQSTIPNLFSKPGLVSNR